MTCITPLLSAVIQLKMSPSLRNRNEIKCSDPLVHHPQLSHDFHWFLNPCIPAKLCECLKKLMHIVCVINEKRFSTNHCFPLAQSLHNNDIETEKDFSFVLFFSCFFLSPVSMWQKVCTLCCWSLVDNINIWTDLYLVVTGVQYDWQCPSA